MQHSPLINKYLTALQCLVTDKQAPVLDLACCIGRNGLYLVENDILVTFAAVKGEALEQVKQSLSCLSTDKQKLAQCWQVDFEQAENRQLRKDIVKASSTHSDFLKLWKSSEEETLDCLIEKSYAMNDKCIDLYNYMCHAEFEEIDRLQSQTISNETIFITKRPIANFLPSLKASLKERLLAEYLTRT